MEKFYHYVSRLSRTCGWIAGILMIVGMCLVLSEIVLRTLFSKTLYITEEYTGYIMAAITFLALAYTLNEKGHIRMSFMHSIVKGKARKLMDIYAFTIGFLLFAVVTYTTSCFFWDSVVSQTRSMQISETYLAIPQFFMPLGAFVMTLQFAAEIIHSISTLRSGAVIEEEVESKALGR